MTSRLTIADNVLSLVPDDNRYQAPEPENVAALPHETLLDLAVYIGRQDRKHAILESFLWTDSRGYIQNDRDDEEYQSELVQLCRTDPDTFRTEVDEWEFTSWNVAAVRAYIDFDFHLDIRQNGYVMGREPEKQLAFLVEAQAAGVTFA